MLCIFRKTWLSGSFQKQTSPKKQQTHLDSSANGTTSGLHWAHDPIVERLQVLHLLGGSRMTSRLLCWACPKWQVLDLFKENLWGRQSIHLVLWPMGWFGPSLFWRHVAVLLLIRMSIMHWQPTALLLVCLQRRCNLALQGLRHQWPWSRALTFYLSSKNIALNAFCQADSSESVWNTYCCKSFKSSLCCIFSAPKSGPLAQYLLIAKSQGVRRKRHSIAQGNPRHQHIGCPSDLPSLASQYHQRCCW